MPGPKPKPTNLKKLEGDPHKERWPKNEPKPDQVMPTCPAHLKGPARTEWRRISKELFTLGLLTQIDRAALAAYCTAYGRWVKAEKGLMDLEKKWEKVDISLSLVALTPNGSLMIQPLVSIANKQMALMHKFLTEFGMTPASRTRIGSQDEGKEDELDEFLQTGKMN